MMRRIRADWQREDAEGIRQHAHPPCNAERAAATPKDDGGS